MPTEHQSDYIKLALPKGKLLPATACLLSEIGLGFADYTRQTRIYRLESTELSHLSAKMFQDKDIPIQVAVGNYDLGICGLDWIEELLTKYPASSLIKVVDLEYDRGNVYMTASRHADKFSSHEFPSSQDNWRIVTEYPNLAEASALDLRLKKFTILPVWGASEAYPPENADLAVLWARNETEIVAQNLVPLKSLLSTSAFLIANQESWQTKNVSQVIAYLSRSFNTTSKPWAQIEPTFTKSTNDFHSNSNEEKVWIAIPDGHQQEPTAELLRKAGLQLQGYSGNTINHRPTLSIEWANAKVIRPQDMPLQVANGNFDLAITGRDWLLDHLYRFPTSPTIELVNLGFGEVRVVAVVSQNLPANDIDDLKQLIQAGKLSPLRVASEYVNIADKYLRDNHVSRYKLVPTWGASEAFLPDDADLLIENTQTGKTLAKHNLKIVDTILQSTACLIGNQNSLKSPAKMERIASLIEIFRRAAESD